MCIDGCHSCKDMSASGMSEYKELSGPNVRVAGGYQNVAKRMAEGLDIKFGRVVSKVGLPCQRSARENQKSTP